jgi:hypothetical protein
MLATLYGLKSNLYDGQGRMILQNFSVMRLVCLKLKEVIGVDFSFSPLDVVELSNIALG